MLAKITRGSSGLSEYLEKGMKKESKYTRQERDFVTPILGDLSINKRCEKFLNKNKNFSHNYTHITLSFSETDELKMSNMSESARSDFLHDLTEDYIKHHTSGYDIKNEVVAYAELHSPKIKKENGKKRYEHIHLMIMNYNPVADTALRTTFRTNDFIDNTLQTYVNKKYGLEVPLRNRERTSKTKMAIARKELIELLQDVKDLAELRKVLKANSLKWEEEKGKDKYFKVLNEKGNDINLRGKGFEHISKISKDKGMHLNKSRTESELGKILNSYYEKRVENIDKRRSKKTKEVIRTLNTSVKSSDKVNSIELSYQQKIFKNLYKKVNDRDFKDYYIDTSDEKETVFINKKKSIKVIDKGRSIVSARKSNNKKEEIELMLDIAEAKEWNLSTIVIKGGEEFQKEVRKEIIKRLKIKKTLSSTEAVAIKEQLKENKSPVVVKKQELENKKEEKNLDLKEVKEKLSAISVLDYAVQKYKLDLSQYEVTADNKINNKTNKQKPKNVIDFLSKEINMTSKEAIVQCQELYKKQPLAVDLAEPSPVQVTEPIKLKERKKNHEYTDQQKRRALHQSNDRADRGRERQARSDMRLLSSLKLVHSSRKRVGVLLSEDERNRLRNKTTADNNVRHATVRNAQTPIKARREIGGIKMPLNISVTKDSTKVERKGELIEVAVKDWRKEEVANYSELATLMKQYKYSESNFKGNYRKKENVTDYNNILIFDIDNEKYSPHLLIDQAKKLLEKHNLSAMILGSRSNDISKQVTAKHQKKHGKPVIEEYHKIERYRIVIPVKKALNKNIGNDEYKEFKELTARTLGIDKYVDEGALTDKARFYYPSPISAVPVIVKANKVLDISKLENKAIENVKAIQAEKEAKRLTIDALRAKIKEHRVVANIKNDNLTFVDAEEIINIPISQLIQHFERGEEKKEGSYNYIKTDATKYSIIKDELAHDFKNDITYNSLSYLQMQFKTSSLNAIARELKNLTGEDYIRLNEEAVKTAIRESLKTAKNDKSFEDNIKTYFGCKFVKLEKDTIQIADQSISLSSVGIDKGKIIDAFKGNRQKEVDKEIKEEEVKEIKSTFGNKKKPEQEKGQSEIGSGRKM